MKKLILSTLLLIAFSVSITSCRDTKKTESVEDAIENTKEATEGALEETGKAIDNAVEKTKEAGEAAKEAVEKIGDN
ncbi:hypothetical protein [Yeosuana sp. AK3]